VLRNGVGRNEYILGEQFTAAAVVIGSALRWGLLFKMMPELPEFTSYVGRLKARPAMQRQLAKDEEIAKRQSA